MSIADQILKAKTIDPFPSVSSRIWRRLLENPEEQSQLIERAITDNILMIAGMMKEKPEDKIAFPMMYFNRIGLLVVRYDEPQFIRGNRREIETYLREKFMSRDRSWKKGFRLEDRNDPGLRNRLISAWHSETNMDDADMQNHVTMYWEVMARGRGPNISTLRPVEDGGRFHAIVYNKDSPHILRWDPPGELKTENIEEAAEIIDGVCRMTSPIEHLSHMRFVQENEAIYKKYQELREEGLRG